MSDETEDRFRWCIYCKADCWLDAEDQEHATDCPQTTGVWPVTERDLGIRGPDDPYAHGMKCMDCEADFKVGDHYTHRPIGDHPLLPGMDPIPGYEVICLGCAAQEATA